MKKILPALVLLSFLAILLLPLVVSAQAGYPPECCKLRRTIALSGIGTCDKGDWVAPSEGAFCPGTNLGDVDTVGECIMERAWGAFCFYNTMYNVTDWIFVILIAVSVVLMMLGAFSIATSAGDPARVSSGRNYIVYAIGGIVLAFFAKAIPGIIRLIMGT